jgi:hypothetical protein
VSLFRHPLFQLIPKLRRLSYGEAAVEFEDKLEEAEDEIAELPPPTSKRPKEFRDENELPDASEFSNNSAVFVAWLEVESAILNLARDAKLLGTNMPASHAAHLLLNRGLIDAPTYDAILDLLNLRNIAVHPTDIRLISKEEADRFERLVEKVAAILENRRHLIA